MNKYECSTIKTPTVEIEANNEREARMIYQNDFVQNKKLTITIKYVGKVEEDRFSRFVR